MWNYVENKERTKWNRGMEKVLSFKCHEGQQFKKFSFLISNVAALASVFTFILQSCIVLYLQSFSLYSWVLSKQYMKSIVIAFVLNIWLKLKTTWYDCKFCQPTLLQTSKTLVWLTLTLARFCKFADKLTEGRRSLSKFVTLLAVDQQMILWMNNFIT